MHQITTTTLTLIDSETGNVHFFNSLKMAYRVLGWQFISWRLHSTGLRFSLTNDNGKSLTYRDFIHIHDKNWIDYTGKPVAYTGKRRGGHYYRRVTSKRTLQQSLALTEEGEIPPRAKRNLSNLPDSWDEYCISSRRNHNWKQFRKTQYK